MNEKLQIKKADKDSLAQLYAVTRQMGGQKEAHYFEKSLDLQTAGERDVFLAFWEGDLAGYVMLSYYPKYGYYRAHNMPEIQDLNVVPACRRRGIGRAMIEYCEALARKKNYPKMGIGVGLTPEYGAAQRLYINMGYIPDGMGVTCDRKTVRHGEFRPFDDDVSLMLEKAL